jgi:hypothetical protein
MMGLKIIKLAVTSDTKIAMSPTVTRYFYEVLEHLSQIDTLKIDAAHFIDDTAQNVEVLPALNLNNSCFNVYINGVLQMNDNCGYTSGEGGIGNLLISIPEGSVIAEGTPIVLEVINVNPTSKNTFET